MARRSAGTDASIARRLGITGAVVARFSDAEARAWTAARGATMRAEAAQTEEDMVFLVRVYLGEPRR